jgi:hypothetical protein
MPSKFTVQELILVILNRADAFEIRPMLLLFIQKVIPYASVEQFSAGALAVARYAVAIASSPCVPQLQKWALSFIPVEQQPRATALARNEQHFEQHFDREIELMSLFVAIALLTKQPGADMTDSDPRAQQSASLTASAAC